MNKVIVRGYRRAGDRRVLIFLEHVDAGDGDAITAAAERHAEILAEVPHIIEFEFPDLPKAERYFRIGTDASLMTLPVAVEREDRTPGGKQ